LQRLRQSWNKYNLYNLARAEPPRFDNRTFFQQKWTAKSLTRAYHGETVREKKWHKLFRRTIKSVINMDPKALAENDGSEQAEGRGSGLDLPANQKPKSLPTIPYLNMTYAPTERRLDTAVFRALFASSTRQARQFVIHGYVKVNGKKVSYLLAGYRRCTN
jgi:ribosomal protein S4